MIREPKTATDDSLPTEDGKSPVRSDAPRRAAPKNSLWIDLYSFLLVGVILAYYAVMIYFAGKLFVWTAGLVRWVFGSEPGVWTIAGALAAVVLAFLCIRTVRHLIYASAGLVTTVHDDVPEADEGIPLVREDHPRLFDLVEDVGRQVGSPMPNEIRMSYPPETFTVELRKFGLSTQRRLVLVLGLPQISVLSVSELRVVLAHELAHFGRGDTRLIVFCSRFLIGLQRSIESIGHRWWHWIDPIYWFQLGYHRAFALLSAPVQRHQELRADCISAATYGGELAARTLLKDCLLSHQFMAALASYQPADNGRVEENFFQWFRRQWHDFTPDGQDYLLRRLEAEERSSFWDPDPTISQRVTLMRSFPTKELQPSEPAIDLIEGFPALAKRLHELMY